MTDVQPSENVSSSDVERFLTAVHSQVVEDPEAVSTAIVAGILQAKTVEDVLGTQETTQAESILGERICIRGVKWMSSDMNDGPGFYALIDAVSDEGTVLTITCGSRNVMAQVYRLVELGALPLYAAIVQSERATAAGYFPMRLEGRTAP